MILDLVVGQDTRTTEVVSLAHQGGHEVADPDQARLAGLLHRYQGIERASLRGACGFSLQQQKVHIVGAKPCQALIHGGSKLGTGKVAGPDVGGDEDFRSWDAGAANDLADLGLIAVHLRRIEVPITDLKGLGDHAQGAFGPDPKGAKTQQRDFAIV